jgi:hypothetical protein
MVAATFESDLNAAKTPALLPPKVIVKFRAWRGSGSSFGRGNVVIRPDMHCAGVWCGSILWGINPGAANS